MTFFDRLLTIVVTATLTSAVWIVFGAAFMDAAESGLAGAVTAPAPGDEETPAGEVSRVGPDGPVKGDAANERAGERLADRAADRTGTAAARQPALAIPVKNAEPSDLTDSFFDPRGDNDLRRHEAIDIMAPEGTLVTAAAPGTIAKIHRSGAGGKSVYVRSSDKKTLYFYAHLDAYANGLKEGAKIEQGQELGTVGTTGNADPDTPHLHFAVFQTTPDAQWWEPANAINPYPLLTEPVRQQP